MRRRFLTVLLDFPEDHPAVAVEVDPAVTADPSRGVDQANLDATARQCALMGDCTGTQVGGPPENMAHAPKRVGLIGALGVVDVHGLARNADHQTISVGLGHAPRIINPVGAGRNRAVRIELLEGARDILCCTPATF